MLQTILSRLGWFVALLAFQVVVFNHIHIAGYATPMPYVFFLAILPASTPRWAQLLLAFALGLLVDIFSNTPGMGAASLTAAAMFTPLLLRAFGPSELDTDDFTPSSRTMTWGGFLEYAGALAFVHIALFFSIEAFSFSDWSTALLCIGSSFAVTLIVMAAFEGLRR